MSYYHLDKIETTQKVRGPNLSNFEKRIKLKFVLKLRIYEINFSNNNNKKNKKDNKTHKNEKKKK